MGEVYRATNVSLGRQVAIKILSKEHTSNEDDVMRFLREARAAAAVRHPNVVDILDVARDDEGTKEGSLVPAFIVGGIGVVALGSFAVFGLGGKSDVSTLEKECKPNCAQSDVDSARTKLIIADISLGVGVVALGVATYMILTRPKVDAEVKTARSSAPPKPVTGMSSVKFDFGALTGGAMGSVGARF
jgi:serine/threonine protein kinase